MCVLLYRLLLEKDAFLSLYVLSLIHPFVANVTITRFFWSRMLLISQYRAFGILLRIVAEILSENLVTGASGCGTPRKDVSVKAGEVEDGSQ